MIMRGGTNENMHNRYAGYRYGDKGGDGKSKAANILILQREVQNELLGIDESEIEV